MEEIKEDNENFDKIKVFTSDDEKLKMLGELLSNKSSRDIIKLLTDNEYYTNQIADKLNLRVNLVIHHLKKLEELGLLEVNDKEIVRKGKKHRYFRMMPNLFISSSNTKEEIEEKGVLKKIFKQGIKFIMVGFVALFSYLINFKTEIIDPNKDKDLSTDILITNNHNESLVISLIVIIIGISIIYLLEKKEKEKLLKI